MAHIGHRDLLIEPRGDEARACVEFRTPPPEQTEKGIAELTRTWRDGKVDTLLIVGGNPVFNAPADLNFRDELKKVAQEDSARALPRSDLRGVRLASAAGAFPRKLGRHRDQRRHTLLRATADRPAQQREDRRRRYRPPGARRTHVRSRFSLS